VLDGLERQVELLSDEELLRMATTDRAEYVPQALAVVDSEIGRRGLENVTSAHHLELKREREQAEERARPRPVRWLTWVFPETSSDASALRVARQGAIVSWVLGAGAFLLALLATRVVASPHRGLYLLLVAVIYVALGFGVWAGSLLAAAAALTLFVGTQAYSWFVLGLGPNGFNLIWLVAFWNGVRGAKALRGSTSKVELSQPQPSEPSEGSLSGEPGGETNRRDIIMEVCVVILLTMGYSMYRVVVGFGGSELQPPASGGVDELWKSFRDLSYIALLLYLIRRSGLPGSRFGLPARPAWQDLPLGIAVWAVDEFASVIFLFPHSWQSHLSTVMENVSHKHWADVAILPVMLLSAFYQELLMRGYFITRFEQLFHSIPLSIVGAAGLFALWHTYQGPWGVMGALISGLIYGAIFVKTRRLPPLVLGHALWNFVSHT